MPKEKAEPREVIIPSAFFPGLCTPLKKTLFIDFIPIAANGDLPALITLNIVDPDSGEHRIIEVSFIIKDDGIMDPPVFAVPLNEPMMGHVRKACNSYYVQGFDSNHLDTLA